MTNDKQFVDPLEDIDPVMEDAFSNYEEENTPFQGKTDAVASNQEKK